MGEAHICQCPTGIASAPECLAMTKGGVIASLFLPVIASRRRGNLGGAWDCFGTRVPRNDKGGCHCEPFFTCHCERSAAISVGHGIASAPECLAMTKGGVIASRRRERSEGARRGNLKKKRAATKPPFILHISLIYPGPAVPLIMNITATISAITITTMAIMPPVPSPSPPPNQPPPTTWNCPVCPARETS